MMTLDASSSRVVVVQVERSRALLFRVRGRDEQWSLTRIHAAAIVQKVQADAAARLVVLFRVDFQLRGTGIS